MNILFVDKVLQNTGLDSVQNLQDMFKKQVECCRFLPKMLKCILSFVKGLVGKGDYFG